MKRLLVIGGATATGKTALAIRLAKHFKTDILSADSRQFYREMSIGTAKPTSAELAEVKHHFIDSQHVTEPYSVGDFERDASKLLDELFLEKDVVVMAGGSGLFIQAVCEGLDNFAVVTPEIKKTVADGEKSGGLAWLQEEIKQRDPDYYQTVDRQNPARLRRALEVCLAGTLPYSAFLRNEKKPRSFQSTYLLLDIPRPELYRRIDERVDAMIGEGLEEEARSLLPYRALQSLRTVGYEEFFEYFDGKMSLEDTIDKIKQHTRNYAKRQATWFRKRGDWNAFHPEDLDVILAFLSQ